MMEFEEMSLNYRELGWQWKVQLALVEELESFGGFLRKLKNIYLKFQGKAVFHFTRIISNGLQTLVNGKEEL